MPSILFLLNRPTFFAAVAADAADAADGVPLHP
jgi:hypothetical protein